jgi:proline iminopeptidase
MDPAWMRMQAGKLPRGSYLYCPNGSHMAMYDDQATYYAGLIEFIATVERDAASR